jgi:hypothetical protein
MAARLREGKPGRDAVIESGVEAAPALTDVVRDGGLDADTRAQALIALAAICPERAREAVTDALQEEHWFLREVAVVLVHRLDLTGAIPRVVAMAGNDNSPEVRRSCLHCLTQLGWRAPDAYLSSLGDADGPVRRAIAVSAFRLRSLPVLSGVVKHYLGRSVPDEMEAGYLTDMLSHIGGCPQSASPEETLRWFAEHEAFLEWPRDAEVPEVNYDAMLCGVNAWEWPYLSPKRQQGLLLDGLEAIRISAEAWQSMEPNEQGDRVRKRRSGGGRMNGGAGR